MTDYKAYKNDVLQTIIKEHFAQQGTKIPNLSKCNKGRMAQIIEENCIPLPEPPKTQPKKCTKSLSQLWREWTTAR